MPPQPAPGSPERPRVRVRLVETPLPPHMGFGYVTRNIVEVEPPREPIDGLAPPEATAPAEVRPDDTLAVPPSAD